MRLKYGRDGMVRVYVGKKLITTCCPAGVLSVMECMVQMARYRNEDWR